MNFKKFIIIMILLVCFTVSSTYAVDIDNSTVQNADSQLLNVNDDLNDVLTENPDIPDSNLNDEPDVPDLIVEDDNHVTPINIKSYFKNGVLDSKYKGKTLIFSGNFTNLGQLTINRDDVTILGQNAIFKNTVFDIEGNCVLLKNLTFNLDKAIKDNEGAAILVNGYDVTLDELNIYYVVPNDVEAYAIYADGYTGYSSDNLKILNSNIYFEGHNENLNIYNCAIKLTYATEAIIENNTIRTSLPLKNVKYVMEGATLDSDFVYSVGLEECHDFIFKNNTVMTDVNKRTAVEYPTLNSIMLSKCDNGIFAGNSIYMTDFVTYPGIENYLYGVDIHRTDNLLFVNNSISIVTTGGKLALGTAYPIQISGPVNGVNITQNDLYSYSNGPNIGIYSQNFYGDTDLSITYNRINVTGLAGTHEWALVTGIESQDTNSLIKGNIIEVHSVGAVNENDNIYAISYRQSIKGDHTFDIQDNLAFSDGYYAVYLLSSDYSTIINNTLVSFNENAQTGSNSYRQGPRDHNGDEYYNNKVINARDYYGSSNSIIIVKPVDRTYEVDGSEISWSYPNINPNVIINPLIPSYINPPQQNANPNDEGNQGLDDGGYGTAQGTIGKSFNSNGNQVNSNKGNKIGFDVIESRVDSEYVSHEEIKGVTANGIMNNSESTPSIGNDGSPLSKSQSSSGSGQAQSVSKSFEIKKVIEKKDFIPSVFLIIIVLILLIIGFKRKDQCVE